MMRNENDRVAACGIECSGDTVARVIGYTAVAALSIDTAAIYFLSANYIGLVTSAEIAGPPMGLLLAQMTFAGCCLKPVDLEEGYEPVANTAHNMMQTML